MRVEEQLPSGAREQCCPWQQPGTQPWAHHAEGMPKGCPCMPGPKLMDYSLPLLPFPSPCHSTLACVTYSSAEAAPLSHHLGLERDSPCRAPDTMEGSL